MFQKIKRLHLTIIILVITVNVFSQSINAVTGGTGSVRQFVLTEFDIQITSSFTNPFDYKDIAVDMVLTSPTAKSIKLPCFFVSGDATFSTWKARITPREAGTYAYHFELSKNEVVVVSSSNKNFLSVPTARKGFLHKNNLWTFKYDNGETFRGVGENYGWEPRNYEESNYRGAYKYEYLLPRLANNGVNFFRTWMCPWNLPLQWKKVTQTNLYSNTLEYFNPGAIAKMDELVEMCDSLQLHMMLTLDYHGALTSNWSLSNFNSANGGPIATPKEFFTNVSAKNMYKNRLRYIVARWGYSPAIGAWEFFNEIDNAVFNESNGGLGNYSHADVTAWHNEMSTFLKGIDPYEHLVTTSVSHRDISGMNALTNLDFNQRHIYGDPYVGQIDQTINNYINATSKPYVIGEFGYRYEDDSYDPYANNWKYDFRQGMWLGLFSPTPILPMTWWWEMFDAKADMTKYFKSISEIHEKMRIASGKTADYAQATATSSVSGQKVMAIRAGTQYYVYILNTTNASVTTNITLSSIGSGTFVAKSFDPKNGDDFIYTDKGTFTTASNSLTIIGNTIEGLKERILVISAQGDTSGEQNPSGSLSIPGKIEMEDYDYGGEGVAYHDYEASNTGSQYRIAEGVDVETCSEGGFNITDIIQNEWVEYTVNVQSSGAYTIIGNVASSNPRRKFHIEFDGEDISGSIEVPDTGGGQLFQNVSVTSGLMTEGKKVMRVFMDSSGFNLNNIEFIFFNKAPFISISNPLANANIKIPQTIDFTVDASDDDGTISRVQFFVNNIKVGEALTSPFTFPWTPTEVGDYVLTATATDDKGLTIESEPATVTIFKEQLPFNDAFDLPAKIEAEEYDLGGEGTAYHDITAGNKFDVVRTEDVDIETCADTGGGFSLGDLQTSEWVEYTVSSSAANTYDIDFRVASAMAGSKFHFEMDGVDITGSISVPNSGGWQIWATLQKKNILIPAGSHIMRLAVESEYFNLNYVNIYLSPIISAVDDNTTSAINVYPNPFKDFIFIDDQNSQADFLEIYNSLGQLMTKVSVKHMKKLPVDNLPTGLYQIRIGNFSNGVYKEIRLIKE
jgi:hypothetical protein